MNYTEQALLMDCDGAAMLGIVAKPVQPAATGLVVLVGGPQYRVGSHRQFVLLARSLASMGYAVLRFDYRGMGDSAGEARSFSALDRDIGTAIDALQAACPQVQHVALWGLCDAAAAALLYWGATQDARVAGLCLLNPWVRSEATLARTHIKHYYGQRVLEPDFWRKLLRGQFSGRKAVHGLWQNLLTLRQDSSRIGLQPRFQDRMAWALRQFDGQVLLILSANDLTAKEFVECASADPEWRGLLYRSGLQRVDVAGADHTFSRAEWRLTTEQAVLNWMATVAPTNAP